VHGLFAFFDPPPAPDTDRLIAIVGATLIDGRGGP